MDVLSSHLQNDVPRKQPIRASGRTILIQTLYVDAPQVPTTERDSHLHPRPAYHHKPRLAHLPVTIRWHSREKQVVSFPHNQCISWLCRGLPDKIAGASCGCGLLGGGSERALVLLTEGIDGRVIVRGGCSAPLWS